MRGDPLWGTLRVRAENGNIDEADAEAVNQNGRALLGTIAILGPEVVPSLVGGPYDGWRLVATVEQRVISQS